VIQSIGSSGSVDSIGSSGSIQSIGSSGSILSIGSTGSILSIGSAGSILSIGSAGSVLSIGSVFSVASVLSAGSVGSVMSALSAWLLPPGITVEVNRDEYTKPELAERAQTYAILNGIRDEEDRPVLSRGEIRQLERFSNSAPSETLTSGVLQ